MKRSPVPSLLIAAALLGAGTAALAGRHDENRHEARAAAAPALLTPEQATTIAEARAGGRVVRTRYDHASATYRFDLAGPDGATRSVSVAAIGGALRASDDAR